MADDPAPGGDLPADLRYTADHEWVRTPGEPGKPVRVGITGFAQNALGDIVYVTLPEVGAPVDAGSPLGELESTKSVSDLYAPVTGTVTARNEALERTPELINSDPYGDGWIVEITPGDASDIERLLDADAYRAGLGEA